MAEPARKVQTHEDSTEDPFRLGWRLKSVRLPDGSTGVVEEPLTAADLLDPQLGDHLVQNSWHAATVHRLFDILTCRYEPRPDVFVATDLKMIWGIPGLPGPAPDVAVIPGVRDKTRMRKSFRVREEGALPVLVVEVVSDEPEHQSADHEEKVWVYEQAGISEYLIIDPPALPEDRCRLTGYRLNTAGRYEPILPDAGGILLSETTGLGFGPARRTVEILDATTGERLLTGAEDAARLRAELNRPRPTPRDP